MRSMLIFQIPASTSDWCTPSRHSYPPETKLLQTLDLWLLTLSLATDKTTWKESPLNPFHSRQSHCQLLGYFLYGFSQFSRGVSEFHIKIGTSLRKLLLCRLTLDHTRSTHEVEGRRKQRWVYLQRRGAGEAEREEEQWSYQRVRWWWVRREMPSREALHTH